MSNSSRKSYVQKKIIADKEHGIHNQSSKAVNMILLLCTWNQLEMEWKRSQTHADPVACLVYKLHKTASARQHWPLVATHTTIHPKWYWWISIPSSLSGSCESGAHAIQNKNRKKDQRPFFTMIGVLLANQKRPENARLALCKDERDYVLKIK